VVGVAEGSGAAAREGAAVEGTGEGGLGGGLEGGVAAGMGEAAEKGVVWVAAAALETAVESVVVAG
jgi:hypothetical protein